MIKKLYKLVNEFLLGSYVCNCDGKSHNKSEIERELRDFNVKEIDIDKKNVIAYHNIVRSVIY